jgi:hypothetical protein
MFIRVKIASGRVIYGRTRILSAGYHPTPDPAAKALGGHLVMKFQVTSE